MLIDHGELDGKRFLQPRTVEAMFARQWKWDGTNGESWNETMQAWGLGNQQWVDASAPGRGDRLVEGGGFIPVGHTGDAYGLHGGFFIDRDKREGIVFLASGTGFDPATNRASTPASIATRSGSSTPSTGARSATARTER
jgi:hypothetical protein